MGKVRKMKPIKGWALIYFDGEVRGITQPDIYCTRQQAREANGYVTERCHRSLCRVARVEIKELP